MSRKMNLNISGDNKRLPRSIDHLKVSSLSIPAKSCCTNISLSGKLEKLFKILFISTVLTKNLIAGSLWPLAYLIAMSTSRRSKGGLRRWIIVKMYLLFVRFNKKLKNRLP